MVLDLCCRAQEGGSASLSSSRSPRDRQRVKAGGSSKFSTEPQPTPRATPGAPCAHPRNDEAHHDGWASTGNLGGLGRNRTTDTRIFKTDNA